MVPESSIPLLFAVAIFFIIVGIVVKVLVLDRKRIHQLFSGLSIKGYLSIDTKDTVLVSKISRLLWELDSRSTINILDAVVLKQRMLTRYICDIHHYDTGAEVGRRLCMVTEVLPIAVPTDIYIHRKIPVFAEQLIMFLRREKLYKIITGLQQDFCQSFSVFTKDRMVITLSQSLQETLLRCSSRFPLDKTSGELAMVHITPEGWTIICQRITRKKHFDALLEAVDKISSSVRVEFTSV